MISAGGSLRVRAKSPVRRISDNALWFRHLPAALREVWSLRPAAPCADPPGSPPLLHLSNLFSGTEFELDWRPVCISAETRFVLGAELSSQRLARPRSCSRWPELGDGPANQHGKRQYDQHRNADGAPGQSSDGVEDSRTRRAGNPSRVPWPPHAGPRPDNLATPQGGRHAQTVVSVLCS